jgi:hypothetical protein
MKKILWISDMGFDGYLPPQKYNRPPLTWIYNLGAYHTHYTQVYKIKEKFDVAIIASIHENIDVKSINLDLIRQISNKVGIQQESHHRNFLDKKPIIDSVYYVSLYQNCDFILTHNHIDSKYFSSLFNKPCFHHPQLIDLDESIYPKKEEIILAGNLDSRYGNFDNYLIGLEINLPINVIRMHTYREEESQLENIIHHPYEADYKKFNKIIGENKMALYLIPYPLGGSFPIQCGMMKVPCISWNTSTTALECYPDLSFDYGDFDSIRKSISLLNNKDFFNEVNNKAYQVILEKYTNSEYYKKYMFDKLCMII